jgi:hypothetical protein
MILDKERGDPEEYSVFIVHFAHHDDAHKTVLNQQKRRYGVNSING